MQLPSTEMSASIQLLQFNVNVQRYAMALGAIECVVRAVELNALPGAPRVIRGIFNLHGRIVPVGDLRRRMGLPDKEIYLGDRIVVARTPSRVLGVLTDGDTDILACAAPDIVAMATVLRESTAIEGIGRLSDGLILIQNLAKFLSIEEEFELDEALNGNR